MYTSASLTRNLLLLKFPMLQVIRANRCSLRCVNLPSSSDGILASGLVRVIAGHLRRQDGMEKIIMEWCKLRLIRFVYMCSQRWHGDQA